MVIVASDPDIEIFPSSLFTIITAIAPAIESFYFNVKLQFLV
jgi:hypothetical protein